MFLRRTAFQAKFTCTNADTGPANSCACTKCIPDASWHAFVSECLAEPVTGECTSWAVWNVRNDAELGREFGDGYEWMTGSAYEGFGRKSTFNGDIANWNTAQVTTMYQCFIKLLRSTKTLGVGTQRK